MTRLDWSLLEYCTVFCIICQLLTLALKTGAQAIKVCSASRWRRDSVAVGNFHDADSAYWVMRRTKPQTMGTTLAVAYLAESPATGSDRGNAIEMNPTWYRKGARFDTRAACRWRPALKTGRRPGHIPSVVGIGYTPKLTNFTNLNFIKNNYTQLLFSLLDWQNVGMPIWYLRNSGEREEVIPVGSYVWHILQ